MNLSSDIPESYDNVHNPKHYLTASINLQPKDVMTYLPSHLANAFKYICRAGKKNNEVEDLKKALEYIQYYEKNRKNQLVHPNALEILKLYAAYASIPLLWGKEVENAKSVHKFFGAVAKSIREHLLYLNKSEREEQLVNEVCRLKKIRLTYPGVKRDSEMLNYILGIE